MALQTQSFVVQPLSGMDQRWMTPSHAAALMRDLERDEHGGWRTCGGLGPLVERADQQGNYVSGFAGHPAIHSLGWFSQHGGARQFLVYETVDGELRMFTPWNATPWEVLVDIDGNAQTNRQTMEVPWPGTTYHAWGNYLLILNGYNTPLIFNGEYVQQAGYSSGPGAPHVQAISAARALGRTLTALGPSTYEQIVGMGAGTLAPSGQTLRVAYRYIVAWVNEQGQVSPWSPASETIYVEAADTGRLGIHVEVPVGPPGTVARLTARTFNMLNSSEEMVSLGGGEEFYFLREIQDNDTTDFEDYAPDGTLGALVEHDDYGPMPTGVAAAATFQSTLFVIQDGALRHSRPLNPMVFPPDNVIEMGDGDGGEPVALYPTKSALVAWKRRGIYLVRGSPADGYSAVTLTKDVGCIAPQSIREIPGLGLMFLADDGVYILEGALENTGTPTRAVKMSEPICDLIDRINHTAAAVARAEVYHAQREYWLTVPIIGGDRNSLTLVFHYDVGAWTVRPDMPVGGIVETHDHRGYLIIGSNDASRPGLLLYSRFFEDKEGTALKPLYRSVHHAFSSVYRSFLPKHVMLNVVGYGNNAVTLDYTTNRSLDAVRAGELLDPDETEQQLPQERMDVYGDGVWGTARWGERRPIPVRFDVGTQDRGPVHQFQIEVAWAGVNGQIIGYDIEAAVGEQRNKKPLSLGITSERR